MDGVVVGADRVCVNGDTANKIGTYNLSIIAAHHKVPFYVAAPITSIDTTLSSGDKIPIEERKPEELISTSKAPKVKNNLYLEYWRNSMQFITDLFTEF